MDEKHINEQLDALRHDTNKNDGKRYLINKGGVWMIGTEMEHPVFNRVIGVRGQMYPYRTLTSIIPLAQAKTAPQLVEALKQVQILLPYPGHICNKNKDNVRYNVAPGMCVICENEVRVMTMVNTALEAAKGDE